MYLSKCVSSKDESLDQPVHLANFIATFWIAKEGISGKVSCMPAGWFNLYSHIHGLNYTINFRNGWGGILILLCSSVHSCVCSSYFS